MRNPLKFVLDAYSGLTHKAPLSSDGAAKTKAKINGWAPSGWAGEQHSRRLTAYLVLGAYMLNVSREFLTGDKQDRDDRREYGDPDLIVDTIMAAVLGEEQTVVVPGAEAWSLDRWNQIVDEIDDLNATTDPPPEPTTVDDPGDPDNPITLDDPADPAEDDDAAADRARQVERLEDELAELADAEVLWQRQEFLQEWARKIHLALRMVDVEKNAVGLGDGVLLLGWDADKAQVVPAVMDPGSYFPVLPDSLDAYEYPTRVHFAWEIPGEDYPDGKTRVRRITYDLRPLTEVVDYDALDAAATAEDQDAAFSDPPNSRRITTRDDDGFSFEQIVRDYAWRPGEPSNLTCYKTDATWLLDELNDPQGTDSFTLSAKGTVIDVLDEDLEIDFLPVVHIPNTPPGGEHFGQSSLTRVLQLIDDLQNADTDAQSASATTGSPIIATFGMQSAEGANPLIAQLAPKRVTRPGDVWEGALGGSIEVVDTAPQLAATREYVTELRDRLAVNSQIPGSLLGTVAPSEVPSGITLQLSFGPLSSMVRKLRLVRSVKYPLLLKMTQRLYQANGVLDDGETPYAEVALGSFLPSDMTGTLELVTKALVAHAISLETAVTMLLEVGFPIDDVAEEVQRIVERDYEAAAQLYNATNDFDVVRDLLGLPEREEDDTAEAAPLIQVDPLTGAPVIPAGTDPTAVPPVVQ